MTYHNRIIVHIYVANLPPTEPESSSELGHWFNYHLESTEDELLVGEKIYFLPQDVCLDITKSIKTNGTHQRVEAQVRSIKRTYSLAELQERFETGLRLHSYCSPYLCDSVNTHCDGKTLQPA